MVVKLFIGKHLAGVLSEKGKQIKFQRREGDGFPLIAHLAQSRIDRERPEAQHILAAGLIFRPPGIQFPGGLSFQHNIRALQTK